MSARRSGSARAEAAMPERSTDREGAGTPPSGAALPSRAWRRIIIVSATVSVLMGGLGSERISRAHGRRHRAAQWTQVSRLAGKAVAAWLVAGETTGLLAC